MKKLLLVLSLFWSFSAIAQIPVKIQNLPTAVGRGKGNYIPIVQAGNAKKILTDSIVKEAKNYTDTVVSNLGPFARVDLTGIADGNTIQYRASDNKFIPGVAPSGGGSSVSPWTISGSDIYRNIGKVGIGTATPSEKLEVNGVGLFGNQNYFVKVGLAYNGTGLPGIWFNEANMGYDNYALIYDGESTIIGSPGGGSGIQLRPGGKALGALRILTGSTNLGAVMINANLTDMPVGSEKLNVNGSVFFNGNVKSASLKTTRSAPAQTGTVKMLTTDSSGLLSFQNIPQSDVGSGSGTLVAGQCTINSSYVDPNGFSSYIVVSIREGAGTRGYISIPSVNRISGTSFKVVSSSNTETSTFDYHIVNTAN